MKFKRILGLALAVLMLATCASFTANADNVLLISAAPAKTVYVSDEGVEGNDGLTPETPFDTYQKAVEAVKDGGTVVLVGDTTFTGNSDAVITGTVVVTAMLDGESTGAVLIHNGYNNYNNAGGSTGLIKFENIQIIQTTNWAPTYFYNLNVEIGDGVTGPNTPGTNSPSFILGGDGSGNGSIGGKMVVRSGKNFRSIILACGRHPKEVNDINLEYYGGNVKFSYGFSSAATLENRPNKVGNVNLLIEEQPTNTEGFIQSSHVAEITGAIQIIMNNNVGVEYSLADEVPAAGGKFVIMSEEGGRADFTGTPGTFKISSTEYTTAVIENDDGLVGEYELEVDGDECYAEIPLEEGNYYISYMGDAPVLGAPYEVVMENVDIYKNQHNISFNGTAIAEKNDGYTLANGTEVPFSINFEGTNYLPARKLSEILGITIGYDADSRTVLVDTKTATETDPTDGIVKNSTNSGAAKVSVAKNSVKIKVDGVRAVRQNENFTTQSGTEVPCSLIYEGTTYLPVRKLAELLGVGIDYDSATGTVLITK